MKINKWKTVLIIQNKLQGEKWEDETEYESSEFKQARIDLKEYRESSASAHGIGYRLIRRKVLNPLSIKNHVAFVNGEIN